jgi:hypothetical protein
LQHGHRTHPFAAIRRSGLIEVTAAEKLSYNIETKIGANKRLRNSIRIAPSGQSQARTQSDIMFRTHDARTKCRRWQPGALSKRKR